MWAALTDLMLPTPCAGCRAAGVPLRYGACAACADTLEGLVPAPVAPRPGLPPCVTLGAYQGILREALLAYKERGRHGLGRPLGALLASAALSAYGLAGRRGPVVLVPVPSTARAARERQGDHMLRLARHAAARLRRAGVPSAVARPLRAMPRPDSAGLDAAARAARASAAFGLRRAPAARLAAVAGRRPAVLLVDDIVTTGATLAAANALLVAAGVPITAAAVLAETARRNPREASDHSRGASVSTAVSRAPQPGESWSTGFSTRDDAGPSSS